MRKSFAAAREVFLYNNGILRASEAHKKGVDLKTLQQMTDAGLLVREGRGIYRLTELPPLRNPDFVQASMLIPHGVICLISSLSFHNLTTQIPNKVYIALPRGTKTPKIEYPPIDVVNLSEKPYFAGIEEHEIDGVIVRIYGKEKTVADCFKFRNKIGLDIAIEALKEYLREPRRNLEVLLNYARIDRVANIMRPYIEAIL
jgi:predicted transcriptional regulator of viral defense system